MLIFFLIKLKLLDWQVYVFIGFLKYFQYYVGSSQSCQQSNLQISQAKTGKLVNGKPQWQATLTNTCNCVFADVILACQGFQTVEQIDPQILSKSGDDCTVDSSNAIAGHSTFQFTYTWDTSFPFTVKSAEIACS